MTELMRRTAARGVRQSDPQAPFGAAVPSARTSAWRRSYLGLVLAADLLALCLVEAIVYATPLSPRAIGSTSYTWWSVGLTGTWMITLAIAGCYDVRQISSPVEEARRIFSGTAVGLGVLAMAALLLQVTVPRRALLVDVPIAIAAIGVGRIAVRLFVRARRASGAWTERVLVVGPPEAVAGLVRVLHRRPGAGLRVVAACYRDDHPTDVVLDVPVLGTWENVVDVADHVDADVVAVAGGVGNRGTRALREVGWALERSDRHLVAALDLADIAGSRIQLSPVDGVPLAWIEHPEFTGVRRVAKRLLDIVGAGLLLIVLSPLMITLALVVRLTSPGPAIFRQRRLGKDGTMIAVWKFRTMVADAEQRLEDLIAHNESDNLLFFKMRDDPRITRIGRPLRRFSLDELPQLVNVLTGSMSLVGPRPLPGQLDDCEGDYRRRLLVKPGLTGLWQVSGRSQLSVEEALRLDLYYVENWSLGLDFAILVRTLWAVVASNGAY